MRIMGNLYTDNLIGTVIGLSVADDWEGARREWEIVGCEVDETHIMQSIYPWLRNLWKKSKSQKGKIDNGK